MRRITKYDILWGLIAVAVVIAYLAWASGRVG